MLFVIRRARRNVEDVMLLHIVRENVRRMIGRSIKILAREGWLNKGIFFEMVNEGSLIEVCSDLCLLHSLFGRRINARTKPIIPQVATGRNPLNPIHRSISRISIPFEEDCNHNGFRKEGIVVWMRLPCRL